ncbi:MAG: hypothetical protein V1722_04720 [Candidatus Micrarchaeota archaeon]
MFKMRFASLFDPYLPSTSIPAFEKVKEKGENPEYNYEFIDFSSANFNGIPLHSNGWTTLTTRYNVTLYCDVCELPVQTIKMHGKTREVHVNVLKNFGENEKSESFQRELEKGDLGTFTELKKSTALGAIYRLQCGRCGRWVAKGDNHRECIDETYGVCKYCANVMRDILKD